MSDGSAAEQAKRRAVSATLARASANELALAVARIGDLGLVADLRAPESGLVMVRGRIGGNGAPFNLGEASVTRAVVRLADGTVGCSYRLGRDQAAARHAAMLDAAWQRRDFKPLVERELAVIRSRLASDDREASRRAAATRVEFFTLARESA